MSLRCHDYVLMIAPSIEPHGARSVGSYYLEHGRALDFLKIKYKILTLEYSTNVIPKLVKQRKDGVDYFKLFIPRPIRLGYIYWCFCAFLVSVFFFFKFGKPRLVVAQRGLLAGTTASWIKSLYKIPFVLIEHSSDVLMMSLKATDLKRLKKAYSGAIRLGAVSKGLAKSMDIIAAHHNSNPISIIPNVAPSEIFSLGQIVKNNNEKKLSLVTVGNLVESKRVNRLIDVVKYLSIKGFDVTLDIIGDGVEKPRIEKLISDRELKTNIKILGKLDRKIIASKLSSYDCFLSASEFETFGVAYLEALLSGLPVVTTAGTGSLDIFSGNKIFGVSSKDMSIQDIADAVVEYSINDSDALRQERRIRVIEMFGKRSVSNLLAEFITIE